MDKLSRAQWSAQSLVLNSTKAQSQRNSDSRNWRLSLLAMGASAILFAGNSFAAGSDSGINDDGGSIATLVSESLTGPLFQSGSLLLGTVRITDLEASEKVVVRIDTLLSCETGSSPTGNLQGQLDAGRVVSPASDTINTGQQTIPFLKVGETIGAGEPLLTIEKLVTTVDGLCGVDDTEQLSVFTGDTVKYCYTINNPGTATLFDIELVDDNGTPGDASDDFNVTISGLADLDGDADLGDLAGVSTVTGEALVTLPTTMTTVVNTAVVTGNNSLSGGNYKELTASDTATVNLEQSPNNPPVADDIDTTTAEDTSVTIDAAGNSHDVDGNLDPNSVTVTNEPLHGTVTNNDDGTLTYTPDPDYAGPDSFDYQICDTDGLCDTATVTLDVTPVNDPPIAVDDTSTINQDSTAVINATTNDSDADGNLDPTSATAMTFPENGTVVNNGDGTFTYTPDLDFFGTDSFDYQVCDTDGACDTATITINVLEVVAVNNPPVAADDSVTTTEDTAVRVLPQNNVLGTYK